MNQHFYGDCPLEDCGGKFVKTRLEAECGDKTGCYMIDGKPSFLSPIECERLQGFPDDWTKGFSKTVRWRLVGNSVTVSLIEYIISKLESTRPSHSIVERK